MRARYGLIHNRSARVKRETRVLPGKVTWGETFRRVSVFLPASTSTSSFLPRATISEVLAKCGFLGIQMNHRLGAVQRNTGPVRLCVDETSLRIMMSTWLVISLEIARPHAAEVPATSPSSTTQDDL